MRKLTSSEECFTCSDPCCRFHPDNNKYFPVFTREEYEAILGDGFSSSLFEELGDGLYRVRFKEVEGEYYLCPFNVSGIKCSIYGKWISKRMFFATRTISEKTLLSWDDKSIHGRDDWTCCSTVPRVKCSLLS